MDQSLTTPKTIAECGGDKRHWNNPWCADRGTSMARNGTAENTEPHVPATNAVRIVLSLSSCRPPHDKQIPFWDTKKGIQRTYSVCIYT